MLKKAAILLVILYAIGSPAYAANITNGFTFSVATSVGGSTGDHFHSSTGGDFGNPAGKAEVGSYNGAAGEEVRGLSEYDLTGLGNSSAAFVTFDVFLEGGLFAGVNGFPFDGVIDVVSYSGNNSEDISDFESAVLATVGSFSTIGLSVGDILSFDISTIYNDAIDTSLSSLGMRIQLASGTDTGGGAWTFDNFRLTTDAQTSRVPEPSVLYLFGFGVLTLRLLSERNLSKRHPVRRDKPVNDWR